MTYLFKDTTKQTYAEVEFMLAEANVRWGIKFAKTLRTEINKIKEVKNA